MRQPGIHGVQDPPLSSVSLRLHSARVTFPGCAYVDESLRPHLGLYAMAAVIVPDCRADEIRGELRSLLRTNQPRLHWREERDDRREYVMKAIAALDLEVLVVAGRGMGPRAQRRARRKCLQHLLWHLSQCKVPRIIFESAGPVADDRDRELVAALRAMGCYPDLPLADWTHPESEPLVWTPDYAVAAFCTDQCGNPSSRELFGSRMRVDDLHVD